MRVFSGFVAASAIVALGACALNGADDADSQGTWYADAATGLAYAREACASCHAVEAGARSPIASAPTFESLAARPDMNRATLAALLRMPHRDMPNFIIESERIDDLAAYLEVLGGG